MPDLDELIKQAQSGDVDAYGQIVRRFQDMAYGYSYSLLGDFHLAEDAAQESFMKAFSELRALKDSRSFPGWFRRIVYTQCAMLRRKSRLVTVPLDSIADAPSDEPDPMEASVRQEMREKVLRAVRNLPGHERVVTTLFYINGYSHKDIAGFLDVTVNTVKSRLHRSRTRLREEMLEMVGDSLRENALTEEFTSRVLSNIPVLKWGLGKECTFAGALEAALAATPRPFDYATIMGTTGLAFRVRWYKNQDGTGWCPSSPVGEFWCFGNSFPKRTPPPSIHFKRPVSALLARLVRAALRRP